MVKAGDYYAEGGATEAYCNQCYLGHLSVTSISRRSLKTKRWNKQYKLISMFARICIDRTFVWRLVRDSVICLPW